MATKYMDDFPLFDELAPMLPAECREKVLRTMELLENKWRNDLCKATVRWVTTGKRKPYSKSKVMRQMYVKVITIIESQITDEQ